MIVAPLTAPIEPMQSLTTHYLSGRNSGYGVSITKCVLLTAVVLTSVLIEDSASQWLPKTTSTTSLPSNHFQVHNARKYLQDLTAMGPRVTGYPANEVQAVDFICRTVREIKANAPEHVVIDVDVQHPSSEFYTDFLGGITNFYSNLTNVVVRLTWPSIGGSVPIDQRKAVLVNSHFDTVPNSPGGADDGLGVAAMLETLRALSSGPSLRNPVVFLFNGAEESIQMGAHGFITQHPWAKSVQYLVNLESIGSGGREMIFQCNSPWLARFYGLHVPYPHAHVIAHELFKYVLWRAAATDWSTLLTYGPAGMVGVDSAYVKNGYVYHTKFDTADIISDGTIKHTGDNLVALARALSLNREFPSSDIIGGPSVFFDILGTWFVSYSGTSVAAFHAIVSVIGLLAVVLLSKTHGTRDMLTLFSLLRDEIYCIVIPTIIGAVVGFLAWFIAPMRWYDGGTLVAVLLYVPPAVLSIIYVRGKMTARHHCNTEARLQGSLFFWSILLIILTACGIMSAYLCCLWICAIVGALVLCRWISRCITFLRVSKFRKPNVFVFHIRNALVAVSGHVYEVVLIPVLCLWCNLVHTVLTMLIPLLGKTGTVTPGDPILGAIIGLFIALPAGAVLPHTVRGPISDRILSFGVVMILIFVVASSQLSAYSSLHPKRMWIQHIHRHITDANGIVHSDHGIWISAFDGMGMSPFSKPIFRGTETGVPNVLQESRLSSNPCKSAISDCYFELPWVYPVADAIRDSYYIPTTNPPVISANEILSVHHSTSTENTANLMKHDYRIVNIEISGPPHMNIILDDSSRGNRILGWSLSSTSRSIRKQWTPPSPVRFEGVHYMQIGFGLCPSKKCKKILSLKVFGEDAVRIAVYGHYMDNDDSEILELVNMLPLWAKGAEWTRYPSVLISQYI